MYIIPYVKPCLNTLLLWDHDVEYAFYCVCGVVRSYWRYLLMIIYDDAQTAHVYVF